MNNSALVDTAEQFSKDCRNLYPHYLSILVPSLLQVTLVIIFLFILVILML